MQNNSNTYEPAEDTFFLEDYIKNQKGQCALEIGTGSGYLTKILEKNFDFVVGTDIDFSAISRQTAKIQNGICCTGADALTKQFDFIVCNLPYLPSEEIEDRTVDGGKEGLDTRRTTRSSDGASHLGAQLCQHAEARTAGDWLHHLPGGRA